MAEQIVPRVPQFDPELITWLANAQARGGSFVSAIAHAAFAADWENYPLLRPLLLELKAKYPKYSEEDLRG